MSSNSNKKEIGHGDAHSAPAYQPSGNTAPAQGGFCAIDCYWPGLSWTAGGPQDERTVRQADRIYRGLFEARVGALARILRQERRVFLGMLFVQREEVSRAGLMDTL